MILRSARSRRGRRSSAATASPDDEFAAIAGPGAEGTLMTSMPIRPPHRPEAQTVLARFRVGTCSRRHYTLYSYAAVEYHQAGGRGARPSLESANGAAAHEVRQDV